MEESGALLESNISDPLVNINQPITENTHSNMSDTRIDISPNQNEMASIKIGFGFCLLILTLLTSLTFLGVYLYLKDQRLIIGFFVFASYFIIISSIMKYKLVIYKLNKNIYISIKNPFNCGKFNLKGNIHFYSATSNETGRLNQHYFFVINDSNFDLDTTNIRKKPSKLFYLFKGINQMGADSLTNIFEVNKNYENPLLFDIVKYTGKSRSALEYNPQQIISRVMKFGEHFFTLYLDSPLVQRNSDESNAFIIIYIFTLPLIGYFILYEIAHLEDNSFLIFIEILIIIGIDSFLYILYICSLFCCVQELRIDFIFSKGFDRIFIGIANNGGEVYSRAFEYDLNDVEKFIFQQVEGKEGNYTLKVLLRNQTTIEIKQIKRMDKADQEGLEYILNGKIRNNLSSFNEVL